MTHVETAAAGGDGCQNFGVQIFDHRNIRVPLAVALRALYGGPLGSHIRHGGIGD